MIVALLIPTGILLSQQSYVSEGETTSIKIHNPWDDWCQMDIEHEIAKEDRWYRRGFWVPFGDERYLVLNYYITDPPIYDYGIEFWPEYIYTYEYIDGTYESWSIKQSGIQVIVPYMPSGGDIGIVHLAIEYPDGDAIITVVVLFSAPEDRAWYVSNVKVILSNLVIRFSDDLDFLDFLPTATVSIEHYVTLSPPIP